MPIIVRGLRRQGPDDQEPQGPQQPPPRALPAPPAPSSPVRQQPAPLLPLAPPPMSAVAEAAQRDLEQSAGHRRVVQDVAFDSPPAAAAKALTLSQRAGMPPADAEQDPAGAEHLAKRQALAMLRERGKNPITSRLMEDLWFAKIQQNDVDNLAATEGTFDWIGRHLKGGGLQTEHGVRGLLEAFDDSPDNQARLRELDSELGRLEGGFIGGSLTAVANVLSTAPIPVAVGAAATPLTTPIGGAIAAGATAFSINSALAAGTAYHQMRLRGIPHDQAFAASALSGVGQGTLETLADFIGARSFVKLGGKVFGKAAAGAVTDLTTRRARVEFLKGYLTNLGTQVGTETAQDMIQWAAEQGALKAAGFSTDDWSTLGARAADSFSEALTSLALLSGVGPAANFFADMRRADRATRTADYLGRLGQQAQANSAAGAAPTIYEAFLEQSGRAHGAETSYIDGQELATVLQQLDKAATAAGTRTATQTLEERVPGTVAALDEAVRTGGDVSLPTSKIVRTELWEQLRPHVRLHPDEASFAQGERVRGEAQKRIKDLVTNLDEEEERSQVLLDESMAIQNEMRDQLLATNRYSRREAEQLAAAWRAVADVQSARMGLTPAGFQQAFPLQISRAVEAAVRGNVLMQFAGWRAKGAPKKALSRADEMRRAGALNEEIHAATGWSVGPTGDLRFEISDDQARWKDTPTAGTPRLRDVLEHPRLFKAYPQLALIPVHVVDLQGSVGGKYQPVPASDDRRDYAGIISLHKGLSRKEKLSVLLHEIQHAIQDIEGADVGGYRSAPYHERAIEVEARNTQARQAMTAEQRAAVDPEQTEDVAREEQVVLVAGDLVRGIGQAAGTLPRSSGLRQEGSDGPRGTFDPNQWRIVLGPKADVSTVLHEFSHALLTIYSDLAAQKVHPTIVEDFDSFLRWAGIKDIDTWRGMTLDQQRERHEQFAAAWESWLFEGKAPTPELQGLFSRFLRILKRVYEVVTGQDGRDRLQAAHQRDFGEDLLPLTDELRGVFARMLATDQQVRDTLAIRGAVPTFQTQQDAAAAGMSADDWIEHQRQRQEADDAAIDDVTRENLKDMRWLSGAKAKMLAKLQQKEQTKRDAIRAKLAPEIEAMPVNRARRWLLTGEHVDEDGNVQKTGPDVPHKLRRDAVPEERQAALKGLLLKDGVDPDVVAEQFGFRSGEALVFELATAPPAERAIRSAVDLEMQRKHSTLADPKQRAAFVDRALHSQARRRFVAAELRALERAVGPASEIRATAREAARLAIANRPLQDINTQAFERAARRSSERAAEALRAGDLQGAVIAKRQHLFNEEMAALAVAAREEVARARDDWNKVWKKDDDLAKDRELGVVSAARAILEAHGEISHLRSGTEYLKLLKENDPELHAELESIVNQATALAKPMRHVTLEQFRELRETIDFLWERARRDLEVEIGERRVRRTEAVSDLVAQAEKTIGVAKAGPDVLQKADRRGLENAGAVVLLKRVEHTMRKIDGGTRGAWTRTIYERLRRPFDAYMADRERLVKKLHERLKALTLDTAKIEARTDELGGQVFNGTADLLGAALHMGNRSNLENMVAGNGWAERKSDRSVDTSGWWRFIQRMVDERKLTKEHLEFLQFVWDMNQQELRPIAQKANRELYGLYFKQIEAAPFELGGQTWAGGYVPSSVDLDHPRARHIPEKQKLALLEDPDSRFRESMAHTGRGFTFTRQMVDLPRLMDVKLQVQHLDSVLRYVHLQPAVRDVASILRDRDFRGYANSVDPTLITGLLTPWLERTARNRIAKPGMNRRLDEFFAFLRRTTGLNFMFGSLRNAAQQITGMSNALAYVPKGHLVHASWDVFRDFWSGETRASILAQSQFMRNRLDSRLGQLHDDIDALLDWTWRGSVKRFTNRHGYFLQSFVQDRVDQVVWLGAFNHAMEQRVDADDAEAHAHAVAEADSAVRRSQGSQTPIDVAAYEAGTPFTRLLTQFSGFFNVTLNQVMEAREHRVRATMRALVVPALGSAVIAAVLSGGEEWEDKDGNGNTDELMLWMFSTQLKAAAGMVPAIGPTLAKIADDRPGDRLSLAPAAALGEAFQRLAAQAWDAGGRWLEGKPQTEGSSTINGTDLRDLATIISAFTSIPLGPVARPLSYLRDQDLGRVEPATSGLDFVRGLLTGQGGRVR